jgi:putative membrane protein
MMMVACAAVAMAPGHGAAQGSAAVLGRIRAVDQGEIMFGQYAMQHATCDSVRGYGEMLVSDHSANERALQDTATALGVTPDSTAASDLVALVQRQMRQLEGLSGRAFDSQFLAFMAQDHGAVQKELDGHLSSGQPAQLIPFISTTRQMVHRHLARAQHLQHHGCRQGMGVHKDTGR